MNCSSSCIGKQIFCLHELLVQDLCTYQLVCAAQPCQVIDDEPPAQGLKQHMTFCQSANATRLGSTGSRLQANPSLPVWFHLNQASAHIF